MIEGKEKGFASEDRPGGMNKLYSLKEGYTPARLSTSGA